MRSSAAKKERDTRIVLSGTAEIELPVTLVASATLVSGVRRPELVVAACDGVIDIVAAMFNVSGRELRHHRRSSIGVSRVRQIAMYVTHVALAFSMREVGHGFGRDRTTVLYACHQIEDLRDDEEFDRIVAMVERVVTAAFGRQAGQE